MSHHCLLVIMASPTKSCTLDPIPTFLLKESLDVLLTYVTAMVNASLRDGCLPTSQKTAIITPLLKKPSLDAGDLKSFRPVSNLTFMSKVVERIVAGQLVQYLQSNGLMPRLQSPTGDITQQRQLCYALCRTSFALLTASTSHCSAYST